MKKSCFLLKNRQDISLNIALLPDAVIHAIVLLCVNNKLTLLLAVLSLDFFFFGVLTWSQAVGETSFWMLRALTFVFASDCAEHIVLGLVERCTCCQRYQANVNYFHF